MSIFVLFTSIIGWVLSKVFGLVKENQAEKKYVDAVKDNLELRAQNAGLWKRREVEQKERDINNKWEEADQDEKYNILKRDFDSSD